jgi:hypothetical protein
MLAPNADLVIACEQSHQLYKSYIKAGFSEEQAFELIKIIVNNTTKKIR